MKSVPVLILVGAFGLSAYAQSPAPSPFAAEPVAARPIKPAKTTVTNVDAFSAANAASWTTNPW